MSINMHGKINEAKIGKHNRVDKTLTFRMPMLRGSDLICGRKRHCKR
jgi:hypothetical protein